MAKGVALRDRTAAAIIDSAAAILAERGETASMEDIAKSAGIGRATLYRYFPNRDELLKAMAHAALQELAARIKDADLDRVPFEEAIARLVRGFLWTGSKYVALSADGARHSDTEPGVQTVVIAPVRELFRRAADEGYFQQGFTPDLLLSLFTGLIRGALDAIGPGHEGVEETAAAVTALFLRGVGPLRSQP